MRRFAFACLFVLPLYAVASFAQDELPSLHTHHPRAQDGESVRLDELAPGLRRLRQGTFDVPFGTLDYRLVSRGLRADLRVAGAAAAVLVGYRGGEPRLELAEWRAYRGNVRLAVTARDGDGGYRLEFTRSF